MAAGTLPSGWREGWSGSGHLLLCWPLSCWWAPEWSPLPWAVSQEESQGREIPFGRSVVDGQRSRVGGRRGVTAPAAKEPVNHLMVTETGCQV